MLAGGAVLVAVNIIEAFVAGPRWLLLGNALTLVFYLLPTFAWELLTEGSSRHHQMVLDTVAKYRARKHGERQ
jgi:hypothetical protein